MGGREPEYCTETGSGKSEFLSSIENIFMSKSHFGSERNQFIVHVFFFSLQVILAQTVYFSWQIDVHYILVNVRELVKNSFDAFNAL